MKNILVPIDGSQPSRNALQHAIDIANAYSAELTIVNITNADAVLDSFDVFEDMTDEKVKDLTNWPRIRAATSWKKPWTPFRKI